VEVPKPIVKQENREVDANKILVPKPIIKNDKEKEKYIIGLTSNGNAHIIEKDTDVKENKPKNVEHKNNIFKL
jgi:hypothetical protein